ncbi:2-iminoacetate synthase ThiH [bacterium]|jgi:2-iminoacetate synthase|nr:2-iminoacetate synthase ThiH [bacterium]
MFSEYYARLPIQEKMDECRSVTASEVETVLNQSSWSVEDMPVLLSIAAQDFLEPMAQLSHSITQQRFGNTIKMFAPLYLSNECYNRCTYCGYSMDLDIKRVTLTEQQALMDAQKLKEKGFTHILLLTGEAPDKAGVDYLEKMIKLLKPFFSSIGLEVYPHKQAEYERLIQAGADGLTLYQETYHQPTYEAIHISGKKRNYKLRMDAPDGGGKAGFHRINVGALLGLYDWRYDSIALAYHVQYLNKHYWQSKLGISVPRIQKFAGTFKSEYPVTDKDLVQFMCAFRLVFPDIGIALSTREKAVLRDQLIPLGVTDMSAESKTGPGGYTGLDSGDQFDISDERPLETVLDVIRSKGYEPMLKDWDRVI